MLQKIKSKLKNPSVIFFGTISATFLLWVLVVAKELYRLNTNEDVLHLRPPGNEGLFIDIDFTYFAIYEALLFAKVIFSFLVLYFIILLVLSALSFRNKTEKPKCVWLMVVYLTVSLVMLLLVFALMRYVEGSNVATFTTERDTYSGSADLVWGDPTVVYFWN